MYIKIITIVALLCIQLDAEQQKRRTDFKKFIKHSQINPNFSYTFDNYSINDKILENWHVNPDYKEGSYRLQFGNKFYVNTDLYATISIVANREFGYELKDRISVNKNSKWNYGQSLIIGFVRRGNVGVRGTPNTHIDLEYIHFGSHTDYGISVGAGGEWKILSLSLFYGMKYGVERGIRKQVGMRYAFRESTK
jgi:hypothetical protein